MTAFHWFPLFVALNALIVTVLALNVSRLRMQQKVRNGDGGLVVMKAAIRAHGNGVEHVGIMGLVVLALEAGGAAGGAMAAVVYGFSLSRVAHAVSMLGSRFDLRRLAATGTYVTEVAAIGWLIARLAGG